MSRPRRHGSEAPVRSVSWLAAVIPPSSQDFCPSDVMGGVTDHSGGPAPESHRLPYSPHWGTWQNSVSNPDVSRTTGYKSI